MSQNQQFDTADAGGWSLASRVFGVGFRRETYANLAYLLVRFPIGIAYFTVLLTGLSLGVGADSAARWNSDPDRCSRARRLHWSC